MKIKDTILGILLLSMLISCSLFKKAQAPKHDATAIAMVQSITLQVNLLYSDLTSASDKTFGTHQSDYQSAEVNLRALAVYDSSRKHSDALMIVVHDTENRFHTYESEHQKAGKVNNAQVLAYKEGMDALLDILFRTENHYK